MKKFINTLAAVTAILSALLSLLLPKKNSAPKDFAWWMPKLFAGALAPFLGAAGLISAALGLLTGAPLTILSGLFGAYNARRYLQLILVETRQSMDSRFSRAFGPDWQSKSVSPACAEDHSCCKEGACCCESAPTGQDTPSVKNTVTTRERGNERFSFSPSRAGKGQGVRSSWQRDLPFWSDAQAGRTLFCDVWSPPHGTPNSGLAILYLHGSAWYMGDKDFGTRDFFRHLAAKGHVVMDAQYRLAPEVDVFGMIADVKHAVAWLKANAASFGADPGRVVLSGGSAGGHLALLAAYAPHHPRLTPLDLQDADLSVRAVAAYYGPCDLEACYRHTHQHETDFETLLAKQVNPEGGRRMNELMKAVTGNQKLGEDMAKKFASMAIAGRLEPVVGGTPEQAPENYAVASPITHVTSTCPPTFLAQGEDDLIVPVEATRRLEEKLHAAGVPVVNLVLPQTDHGFDLALPRISAPAQTALYELDQFLALVG